MSGIEAAFFGAVGQDAEPKTSKSGKPYLRLSVRVGDGDAAQWVSVLCFDADAISIANRFQRGAGVYVEGKLSLNEWNDADGVGRTGLSVMSWNCRLAQIGRNKPKREKANNESSTPGGNTFNSDEIPFAPEVR